MSSAETLLPVTRYRVNQLDALQLDHEIINIIKEWIDSAVSTVNGRLRFDYEKLTEFTAKLLVVYVPMLCSQSTFGMSLQGMTFSSSLLRRLVFITFDALLPVLSERASRPLRNLMDSLRLLNYLAFLALGRFPTLLHRLLRLAMNPASLDVASSVDYAYMNRQLLWQAMTEAALVLLPAWRSLTQPGSKLQKWLWPTKRLVKLQPGDPTACAICGHEKPRMIRKMPDCRHIYCFYCYGMYKQDENGESCPACK